MRTKIMTVADFNSLLSSAKQFYHSGKVIAALEALEESIKKAKDEDDLALTFEYLGKIYASSKHQEKALEFYFKSLEAMIR